MSKEARRQLICESDSEKDSDDTEILEDDYSDSVSSCEEIQQLC